MPGTILTAFKVLSRAIYTKTLQNKPVLEGFVCQIRAWHEKTVSQVFLNIFIANSKNIFGKPTDLVKDGILQ